MTKMFYWGRARARSPGRKSRQNLHKVLDGDQCGEDQTDDKQANGIQREIKVKSQMLGTVTSFKYLGASVSDDGSKPEILSRIAQAFAALTKLKPIWRDNNVSLGSKVKLMRSLVISLYL